MDNTEKRQWIEARIGRQCLLQQLSGDIDEYKLVGISKKADMVKIQYHADSGSYWKKLDDIEIIEELD